MNRISRSLIGGLCAGGLLFGAASAQSPSYVTYVVVPYPSGGLPDTLARTVFNQVTLDTGQQFVIDNKGGAGGIIGIKAFLSRAMPDGKTLLLLDDGTASINPVAIPDLPYDPVRDFSPIAQVIAGPLQDFIKKAKANPGIISYASFGTTIHGLGMERLAAAAGVKVAPVPYRGIVAATTDLLRGEISVMFASLISVMSYVQTGELKLLGIAALERSSNTPDIPTIASMGFPGFKVTTTMGFAAAAGTPTDVVQRLNRDFNKATQNPTVKTRIETLGVETFSGSPEDFAQALQRDRETYSQFFQETKFKLN